MFDVVLIWGWLNLFFVFVFFVVMGLLFWKLPSKLLRVVIVGFSILIFVLVFVAPFLIPRTVLSFVGSFGLIGLLVLWAFLVITPVYPDLELVVMIPLMYVGVPVLWSWIVSEVLAILVLVLFPFALIVLWDSIVVPMLVNPLSLVFALLLSFVGFLFVYFLGQVFLKQFMGEKELRLF